MEKTRNESEIKKTHQPFFLEEKDGRSDAQKFSAFKMMFRRYLHFRGFSSRREYWWAYLHMAVIIIFSFALVLVFPSLLTVQFMLVWLSVFLVVSIFPVYALLTRRLADAGYDRRLVLLSFLPVLSRILNETGLISSNSDAIVNWSVFAFFLVLTLQPTKEHVRKNVRTI